MPQTLKNEVIKFISDHLQNFAWGTQEMKEIDPVVAEHGLNISPIHKLVKQKQRQFDKDKLRGMTNEVNKLLTSGFIH